MNLIELRKDISRYFSKSELRTLCFELGIGYEDLSGETLEDKTRELVVYCQRHGRLQDLVEYCRQARPNVDWTVAGAREKADQQAIEPSAAPEDNGVLSYLVQKVFSAPFHYAVSGVHVALVHPDLFEIIKSDARSKLERQNRASIEIPWEEEQTFEKELIGPVSIKNSKNNRSIIVHLTSIEPEYSRALRKDSVSLSSRDRTYLDLSVGVSPVEIVPTPRLSLRTLALVPAPADYRSWGGWSDNEEEEEEEEE